MYKPFSLGLAVASLGFGIPGSAWAHLEYYDLNKGYQVADRTDKQAGNDRTALPTPDTTHDQIIPNGGTWEITEATDTAPRTVSVTVDGVKRFSWIAGTNPTLGDSHAAQFFNFHLDQDSYVNIDWTQESTGLDPAFTLYKGLLVYQGHDDAPSDPLNPVDNNFRPVQSDKDSGTATDVLGIVSAYRNTLTNSAPYIGQFNALGGWSQGRQEGSWWSAVQYLTHKNDNAGASESLANYPLPAGDYTIAAGGAACNDNATNPKCLSPSLSATLTFSASTHVILNPPACDSSAPSAKPRLDALASVKEAAVGRAVVVPVSALDCDGKGTAIKAQGLPLGATLSEGALDARTGKWTQRLRWIPSASQANKVFTVSFKAIETDKKSHPASKPYRMKIRVWPTSPERDSIAKVTVGQAQWQASQHRLIAQGKVVFNRMLSKQERLNLLAHTLAIQSSSKATPIGAPVTVKPSGPWRAILPLAETEVPCAVVAELKDKNSEPKEVKNKPAQCVD